MVNIVRRMRMFRGRLALLRSSPGAYEMPDVKKITLQFAKQKALGHWGPRKFWRNFLPGLKFYNPDLDVTIKREHEVGGPCIMTVERADGKTEQLEMEFKEAPDIAKELFARVKAKPVKVSEEDKKLAEQYIKDKELLNKRYDEMMERRKHRAAARRQEELEKSMAASV